MQKLDLSKITLVCVDNRHYDKSLSAILKCMMYASFGEVKFFTNHRDFAYVVPDSVQLIDCWVNNIEDYSQFIMGSLNQHVDTDYVLIVQHDGYILNPKAWTDEFYDWDYIGAPWWYSGSCNVGNGGFSLRSKKFLCESEKLFVTLKMIGGKVSPEDEVLCRDHSAHMLRNGIRFAPEILAARFSLERNGKFGHVWNGQFGFHNNETIIDKWYSGTYEMWNEAKTL